MTEENYNYRTSQTLLRNQFPGKGKWKIPVIPKFQPKDGDFSDLLLIGFDKTNLEDQNHLDRMVHFFLYDYRFERVWKNPEADIERLSRYRAVLSPDFSMYLDLVSNLLHKRFRRLCQSCMRPLYHKTCDLRHQFYSSPNLYGILPSGHSPCTARNCVHNPHARCLPASGETGCCSK